MATIENLDWHNPFNFPPLEEYTDLSLRLKVDVEALQDLENATPRGWDFGLWYDIDLGKRRLTQLRGENTGIEGEHQRVLEEIFAPRPSSPPPKPSEADKFCGGDGAPSPP